jgi:hypothetical protein
MDGVNAEVYMSKDSMDFQFFFNSVSAGQWKRVLVIKRDN